jgi:hypothetical protein
MFKNRFLLVLGLLSLLLVAMSVFEEAERIQQSRAADAARWEAMGEYYANQAQAQRLKEAQPYVMDSATHSYTAWAKAAEAEASTVDSATRSYIAQAKAVACGVDATYGLNLDSATRSYIAWGLALQAKNDIESLCR